MFALLKLVWRPVLAEPAVEQVRVRVHLVLSSVDEGGEGPSVHATGWLCRRPWTAWQRVWLGTEVGDVWRKRRGCLLLAILDRSCSCRGYRVIRIDVEEKKKMPRKDQVRELQAGN